MRSQCRFQIIDELLHFQTTGPQRPKLGSLAVEQKPSNDDRNKKLNTSLLNRKSKSDLKCGNILLNTVWLADDLYCMQQFCSCFIGCVA